MDARRRSTSRGAFQGLIALDERAAREGEQGRDGRGGVALLAAHDGRHARQPRRAPRKIYALFKAWLETKNTGKRIEGRRAGFDALNDTYRRYSGDAIPQPPDDWSAEKPTDADLATPFGKLYTAVNAAVIPNK